MIFPPHLHIYSWCDPDDKRAIKCPEVLFHITTVVYPYRKCNNHIIYWYFVVCGNKWNLLPNISYTVDQFLKFNISRFTITVYLKAGWKSSMYILNSDQTDNETLEELFSNIKGQSSPLRHSNEAASFVMYKLFSLWHYFGVPVVLNCHTVWLV